MARKVFYSFHFAKDAWRAGQVRNIGVVEKDEPVSDNDWEAIKKKGDDNIRSWINAQIEGKSCVIVLIGAETASRPWVDYEIRRGWDQGKGVLGIRIHRLQDAAGNTSVAGSNPFGNISLKNGSLLSSYVTVYDPAGATSKDVYKTIQDNLAAWVEAAIKARG